MSGRFEPRERRETVYTDGAMVRAPRSHSSRVHLREISLSAELLGGALSKLGGAVLILDQELSVRASSGEAEALLGVPVLPGSKGVELLCGDRVERPVARALSRGEPVTATVVRPRVDGSLQHVHVRALPIEPAAPTAARASAGYLLQLEEVDPGLTGDAPEVLAGIATRSPRMKQVFRIMKRAALRDATVLIRGESGVGKELAAHAIHSLSPRASGPFRAINCAALPPALLESELFGHRRGAFTGAVRDHDGFFRAAHQGTLFLDEVAELSIELQAKLLRALETRTVTPVGGRDAISVDVRIIAATHRSLRELVANGKFRADLMYRLRVVPLRIPPLRERPEDILFLAARLLAELQANQAARPYGSVAMIADDAQRKMRAYPWPGNVRELRNALEYALVVGESDLIRAEDLPEEIVYGERLEGSSSSLPDSALLEHSGEGEEGAERARITRALANASGQLGRAAHILGVSRTTLWRHMKRLGIQP